MDIYSIIGIIGGTGLILLGQAIEGGHAASLVSFGGAFIVVGGTFGAVLLATSPKDIKASVKAIKLVFGKAQKQDPAIILKLITDMARTARRDGLLALDAMVSEIDNDFMKMAVEHMVDGVDASLLREILEAQITKQESDDMMAAKTWEGAGGYSPTIGIIGAVLGLIHTMENLSDPSKIGGGIAVAFVATVYGVGIANLIFLPIGAKLKRKIQLQSELDEMIMEGILAVQAGHNAHVIEARLKMYCDGKIISEGEKEDATAGG
jgi:chemotaxis protein MotA